jgi:hypothetical protein
MESVSKNVATAIQKILSSGTVLKRGCKCQYLALETARTATVCKQKAEENIWTWGKRSSMILEES